jgi:hypothetical protein
VTGEIMGEGKEEFYVKAKEALTSKGYTYYDGDKDIRGKGSQHKSKPDYIAIKKEIAVIGEIKSPKEGPTSSSWRQPQNSDGECFVKVRLEIAQKESSGKVSKEVGGHEIIIRGQLPDYREKLGNTYDPPVPILNLRAILLGYTFPKKEKSNVDVAFINARKKVSEEIDSGNGAVTYIYRP